MAGKLTLPIAAPLFPSVTGVARRGGLVDFSPDFRRLLRYGRAVDTRRLVEEVGFTPRYDTVEAVADYVRHQSGRRLVPAPRRVVAR
jgi:UDP-glucose 4-epimerase